MSWSLGMATGACPDRPILEILPLIRDAGAVGIEVGTPPRHFDAADAAQVRSAGDAARRLTLTPISIHAPFSKHFDLAHPDAVRRHAGAATIRAAMTALRALGGQLVVVHPSDLERHEHDVQARLADSLASLHGLADECRHGGLTLVVESPLPHLIGGHPDEFAWLLHRLDRQVGVCLDTGHTFLGRHWHRFLNVADGRLAHVHLNDNAGRRDDHLPPGDGHIDWAEIARTLMAVNFRGWAMIELHCSTPDTAGFFSRAWTQSASLLGR